MTEEELLAQIESLGWTVHKLNLLPESQQHYRGERLFGSLKLELAAATPEALLAAVEQREADLKLYPPPHTTVEKEDPDLEDRARKALEAAGWTPAAWGVGWSDNFSKILAGTASEIAKAEGLI
jgi:hypothetical protein